MVQELATGGKLSAASLRSTKPGLHGDGRNLWLQVTASASAKSIAAEIEALKGEDQEGRAKEVKTLKADYGAALTRSWVFRYMLDGTPREMGLGSAREVSLIEARARAAICRRLLRERIDPLGRRRELEAARAAPAPKSTTFKDAATRYINSHKSGWKNAKHAAQWTATLEAYAYPTLGDLAVHTIDTDLVMKVLEPIWNEKAETASRVRGRVELVLDWAAAMKLRKGENPARWRGHLDKLLPRRSKVRTVKHHPALPYAGMGAFWRDLGKKEGMSAEALRFAILTACRTGEAIGARWGEIDLTGKCWTIPAARMKAGREHRVPLSAPAIELLRRLKPEDAKDDGFVFPGAKGNGPLSSMALLMLIRGMEAGKLTSHGFRSTFRDWAAETTAFPNEMVEMALAHSVSDKVEAAYRRGDMFDRRRQLMDSWATYCLRPPAPKADNVHPIGEARA